MHRIPRPLLRAATVASLLVLAGMAVGAQAHTTMRPASTDTTQAPTRTPPGARGEDPHYPASGTQGQDSGAAMRSRTDPGMHPMAPGGAGSGMSGAGSGNRPANGN
ncbi:hypothetical protein [Burkholderia gladioli]|uniref:hypothetical protein n=1 Tax=Burkholderia gladioli TaxID=28095 RepID=UPI00163E8941|nr:hypothetical protein [Burkholderia gladioli]